MPARPFGKVLISLMTALLLFLALPLHAHEATLGGSKWCFGKNRIQAAIELGASLFPEIRGVREGGYDLNALSDDQLKKLTAEVIEPYIAKKLSISVNGKLHPVKVTRVVLEGSLWRIWLLVDDIGLSKGENLVKIDYRLLFDETNDAHLNIAYMYESDAAADALQQVIDYSHPVAQHSFETNSRIWQLSLKGRENVPLAASDQAGTSDASGVEQGKAPSGAAALKGRSATRLGGKNAMVPLPVGGPESVAPSGSSAADLPEVTPSGQTPDHGSAAGDSRVADQANGLAPNNAPKNSLWSGASEFILLGMKHILIGYDHMAFLLALIVIGLSVREVLKIITAFTMAHSITLLLAALEIVRLNSRVVEAVIALSICYVALENLLKKEVNYRWLVTFGFGLIHGFGFAGVLQDFIVGKSNLVLSVLSFNIGVEIGQLLIFLVLLPVLQLLKNRMQFRRVTVTVSAAILVLGLTWLVERLFNLELLSF
ncbi:MAG: hypothetical protein A2075_11380 [Geobacteraceae bacterium GWC2_58_44]|nr:MAG: hypothetical protein A2075_11380 [Geobacteraceae bacterium GWC2_58_44]HBG04848.1 hypothetical protein [Geobacter sp.]